MAKCFQYKWRVKADDIKVLKNSFFHISRLSCKKLQSGTEKVFGKKFQRIAGNLL